IDDDAATDVDQIVVGVGKERRSLQSASPLCCGIRGRDELRHDLGRATPCRIVEQAEILLHRSARRLGITLFVPLRSRYRTLTVGLRLDQACVGGETLAADQTGCNAPQPQTLASRE